VNASTKETDAMTPTRLYHLPGSRSTRVLWALAETGAPYELTVMSGPDRKEPEHLARHPLGRVPVIEDDGGCVFESGAIVLALADRYPDAGLNFALGTRERELVYQWVLFAVTEIERYIAQARDERERDPERSAAAAERVVGAAGTVEDALRGNDFIVGERLTAADIMLGSMLAWASRLGLLDGFPEIDRYLGGLTARPAYAVANAPASG
jgi:glutathione S-transferase